MFSFRKSSCAAILWYSFSCWGVGFVMRKAIVSRINPIMSAAKSHINNLRILSRKPVFDCSGSNNIFIRLQRNAEPECSRDVQKSIL
jgi:hypothetical protein